MNRPQPNEYDKFYEGYVSLVKENDITAAMQDQLREVRNLFSEITEEGAQFAYAEGKWTIKELLGHLVDGERIFAYRALRISRGDRTPVEGFEQNSYVENSNFSATPLGDLVDEFALLRQANLILFKNLDGEAWLKMGTASDVPVSVRALAYIMVGHIRHHLNILRERYL